MRIDVAQILIGMNFNAFTDFIATLNEAGNDVTLIWLSASLQPTISEIDAFALANPNAYQNRLVSDSRLELVSMLIGGPQHAKLMRALMLSLLDEFNLHAVKINAILTAIDNGGTLAQVKSNIAAIVDYPTRTKANLITALTNKINAGDADV